MECIEVHNYVVWCRLSEGVSYTLQKYLVLNNWSKLMHTLISKFIQFFHIVSKSLILVNIYLFKKLSKFAYKFESP
jgi:hypothetical protein